MEGYVDSRPGLALVQSIVKIDGPGTVDTASAWNSQFGFEDVIVWGDTTDYIYTTWMSGPPANAGYPGTMVIDIDTMTLTAFNAGGPETATAAVQAILDAPHPCAEY